MKSKERHQGTKRLCSQQVPVPGKPPLLGAREEEAGSRDALSTQAAAAGQTLPQ